MGRRRRWARPPVPPPLKPPSSCRGRSALVGAARWQGSQTWRAWKAMCSTLRASRRAARGCGEAVATRGSRAVTVSASRIPTASRIPRHCSGSSIVRPARGTLAQPDCASRWGVCFSFLCFLHFVATKSIHISICSRHPRRVEFVEREDDRCGIIYVLRSRSCSASRTHNTKARQMKRRNTRRHPSRELRCQLHHPFRQPTLHHYLASSVRHWKAACMRHQHRLRGPQRLLGSARRVVAGCCSSSFATTSRSRLAS